jgi:hypothetical protein
MDPAELGTLRAWTTDPRVCLPAAIERKLVAAHDYWRARALVEESDLGGVSAAHVLTYLRDHDWTKDDPTNGWSWTSPGPHPHVVYIGADDPDPYDVVMAIAGIAMHERRPQFDVLDDMAARAAPR